MHNKNVFKQVSTVLSFTVGIPLLMLQPAMADPITFEDLQLENSSQYLGIHMGDKDSGADVFSVGSDGGSAGSNNRSALGRINDTRGTIAVRSAG